MKKNYNISTDSLAGYMSKNHATKNIVGETADAFLVQRGSHVQQIRKADIEAFGIREGIVENGMDKHESQNFGMKASKHSASLKANNDSKEQIQDRFNDDLVYQSALEAMSPQQRSEYKKVMTNASEQERVQMAENVRLNYRDAKYDAMKYATSGQASRDLDALAEARTNPAKGNFSYPKNGVATNQ